MVSVVRVVAVVLLGALGMVAGLQLHANGNGKMEDEQHDDSSLVVSTSSSTGDLSYMDLDTEANDVLVAAGVDVGAAVWKGRRAARKKGSGGNPASKGKTTDKDKKDKKEKAKEKAKKGSDDSSAGADSKKKDKKGSSKSGSSSGDGGGDGGGGDGGGDMTGATQGGEGMPDGGGGGGGGGGGHGGGGGAGGGSAADGSGSKYRWEPEDIKPLEGIGKEIWGECDAACRTHLPKEPKKNKYNTLAKEFPHTIFNTMAPPMKSTARNTLPTLKNTDENTLATWKPNKWNTKPGSIARTNRNTLPAAPRLDDKRHYLPAAAPAKPGEGIANLHLSGSASASASGSQAGAGSAAPDMVAAAPPAPSAATSPACFFCHTAVEIMPSGDDSFCLNHGVLATFCSSVVHSVRHSYMEWANRKFVNSGRSAAPNPAAFAGYTAKVCSTMCTAPSTPNGTGGGSSNSVATTGTGTGMVPPG